MEKESKTILPPRQKSAIFASPLVRGGQEETQKLRTSL